MKKILLFSIITTALLFPCGINVAQSPHLGTTYSFGLFIKDGGIINVGPTVVRGDMGTNAGNAVGFPLGIVMGQTHIIDAVSSQAEHDVNVLKNDLDAAVCDSALGFAFGNNLILAPKVYCIEGGSVIVGDLILDGHGDPNALFIFKVNGNFSINNHSSVVLMNLASLDNVYWQVNGNFELGDSAIFMGTLLADGNVNLLDGSSVFGRVLSHRGAIFLNNNFITTGLSSSPLAIKISSINVITKDQQNNISWTTNTEERGDLFEIERSSDGKDFSLIHIISANGQPMSYSFKDENPLAGVNYYRLKLKDASGTYAYSPIVTVTMKSSVAISVMAYPNPVVNKLSVVLKGTPGLNSTIIMTDVAGRVLKNIVVIHNRTDINTTNLANGTYFVKYFDENGSQSLKIVK